MFVSVHLSSNSSTFSTFATMLVIHANHIHRALMHVPERHTITSDIYSLTQGLKCVEQCSHLLRTPTTFDVYLPGRRKENRNGFVNALLAINVIKYWGFHSFAFVAVHFIFIFVFLFFFRLLSHVSATRIHTVALFSVSFGWSMNLRDNAFSIQSGINMCAVCKAIYAERERKSIKGIMCDACFVCAVHNAYDSTHNEKKIDELKRPKWQFQNRTELWNRVICTSSSTSTVISFSVVRFYHPFSVSQSGCFVSFPIPIVLAAHK